MLNNINIRTIAVNFHQGDIDKRPFIFLHGNTQNDTCGKGVLDYFKHKGHTTLSYDLPGHGDSKLEGGSYVFSDLIDLNNEIITQYQLIKPILCGHSLGGMIHAGTIARFNLIGTSLILCGSYDSNPVLFDKKMEDILAEYIAESEYMFEIQIKYDYFKNRNEDDERVKLINRQYTQPKANAMNLQTINDFSAREELIKMEIPILVLHGEEETVILKPLVEAMVLEYKNMHVAWYQGKGHNAFYQQPNLTNKYLDMHYSFLI